MFGLKNLSIVAPLLLSKALKKDSLQRKRVNEHLARVMGENKGMWLKLGQMLSIKSDQWQELDALPSGKSVQTIAEPEFNSYIQSLFEEEGLDFALVRSITHPGIAASLSQVHEVELLTQDEQSWVIKAKLPGIHEVVSDQLKVFNLIGMSEKLAPKSKSFSTADYSQTFRDSFERELDYEQERTHLVQLQALAQEKQGASIPKLHPSIQGQNFITMQKAQGQSWSEVISSWSIKEKRRLAQRLVDHYLYQYFILGCAQGDFHPGNFLFSKENNDILITWIDLGQCLKPSLEQRKALYCAIEGASEDSVGDLFNAWSFDLEKLSPLKDRLPLILQTLFHPLQSQVAVDLRTWDVKKKLEAIMGQDKWFFRTAGSSELFLSIRCWLGLIGMLEKLQTPLHLSQVWQENRPAIAQLLKGVSLERTAFSPIHFDDMAKSLIVKITEDGRSIVDISLPARAIENLKDFLSPEVMTEIQKNSIDIDQVIADVLQGGLKPKEILDLTLSQRHYQVALV
jgi:predicted unusual protein kinase regulating ubiquinone biosynthesis (AarF/ABC1/UbiB family)